MTRESSSIQTLLAAAEQSIPNLDGHRIRVAERRILWSKLAQQEGLWRPTITDTQAEAWNTLQQTPEDVMREVQKERPTITEPQANAWNILQQTPGDVMADLKKQPAPKPKPPVQTGMAHKPSTPTPAAQRIELPEMTISPEPEPIELPEMIVDSGPGAQPPNYTGASKSIRGLVRVANYLVHKQAVGKTFEQAVTEYRAAGGDKLNAGRGQYGAADTSKQQYEAILNAGKYLPPELPENMGVEIRTAIQSGRAVGVIVLTNPANPKIADLIDNAVRRLVFPMNAKMDFVITKFLK